MKHLWMNNNKDIKLNRPVKMTSLFFLFPLKKNKTIHLKFTVYFIFFTRDQTFRKCI